MANEVAFTIDGEQFKPLIYRNQIVPGYFVSNTGKAYSKKRNKFLSLRKKYSYSKAGKRIAALCFDVAIPINFYDDYSYRNKGSKTRESVTISMHKAVLDAWLPINENLPDDMPQSLKDAWAHLTDDAKEYIEGGLIIDHKDNNPENNHISNIARVRIRNNNVHVKSANGSADDATVSNVTNNKKCESNCLIEFFNG